MARSQLQDYFTGLESENEDLPEIQEEEVEAMFAEVEEAGEEVENVEQDIDEMEEVDEGLEQIALSLEAALENGGLDPVAAQFAAHAVDGYTQRIGLSGNSIVPGIESFGGDTGREASTQVSIEGVAETLKKLWAAIKAAVEKSIKAVMDFFTKLFGGVEKIQARIQGLEEQIKEAKKAGLKPGKDAKVTVPNPNTLMLSGSVKFKDIEKGVKNLISLSSDMHGKYLKDAIDTMNKTPSVIKTLMTADEEKIDKDALELAQNNVQIIKATSTVQGKAVSGDKTLVAEIDEAPTGNSFPKASLKFTSVKGAAAFKGEASIDPLSFTEMNSILSDFNTLLKDLAKAKDGIAKLGDAREKAMDNAKAVVDKVAKDDKLSKVVNKASSKFALFFAQRQLAAPITSVDSHSFAVVRSGLSLVEKSLAAYKSDKEGDKK